MRNKLYSYSVLIVMTLVLLPSFAHADSFVRTSLSKRNVFPTEPLTLKIKVFTSTWFTRAPDLYDLQVPNCFTYRTGRPLLGGEMINSTRYTTTEFSFVIFPAVIGDIEIKPFPIEFETPDEGDYKGKKKKIRTKKITFAVKEVPENYSGRDWVIANNITLREKWGGLKDTLMMGDVLYRTFTVRGSGIPAALIPRVVQDSINLGSVYVKSPNRNTEISEDGIIFSSYSETVTLLLEKAGELTIPEVQYSFFDLQKRRQVNRTLKARTIVVKENPNLAMLHSLQNSLAMETKEVTVKKPFTILGFNPYQFGAGVMITLGILCFFIRIVLRIISRVKAKRKAYYKSEKYAFSRVKKACATGDTSKTYNAVTEWYLQFKKGESSPSLKEEAHLMGYKSLYKEVTKIEKLLVEKKKRGKFSDLQKKLRSYRKMELKDKVDPLGSNLNPA